MSTVINSKIQGIMRWLLLSALFLIGITPASAHYDPRTGRWLSRDPLGEEGGANLYAYCANDPVNKHDPLGLADQYTVADAESVEYLLALAKLTGNISDSLSATVAEQSFLRQLEHDPEPWASLIYRQYGASGLAAYVGNRDQMLAEAMQFTGLGLFYGGAGLRVVGGGIEVGLGLLMHGAPEALGGCLEVLLWVQTASTIFKPGGEQSRVANTNRLGWKAGWAVRVT